MTLDASYDLETLMNRRTNQDGKKRKTRVGLNTLLWLSDSLFLHRRKRMLVYNHYVENSQNQARF